MRVGSGPTLTLTWLSRISRVAWRTMNLLRPETSAPNATAAPIPEESTPAETRSAPSLTPSYVPKSPVRANSETSENCDSANDVKVAPLH